MSKARPLKVLFISSSGGHWVQMNRLSTVFSEEQLVFASTEKTYAEVNPNHPFYTLPEASRNSGILSIIRQALCVIILLAKVKPDIVLSTGASVGFFAIFFAKKLGARTIWVDSIANVDSVSMSGKKAEKYADLFITQWEHLSKGERPAWFGAVI